MSLLPFLLQADSGRFWGFGEARVPFHGWIWQTPMADFDQPAHEAAVERILRAFEDATGKQLQPGSQGRAALKVYTNSGAGIQTPPELVRAVLSALRQRGFSNAQLLIIDARESLLRAAGYLPPISRAHMEGPFFEGVRVHALDAGELRSDAWYYESPLPLEFTSPLGRMLLQPQTDLDPTESRRSYLPSKLLTEVDFWINLPVAVHHPATEMSGALLNASLWNITNHTRFLSSPANAPVAVAEIAAIPEIQDTWALNIISMEAYQYIGGPSFNANYTARQPQLWASVDPVILDSNLIAALNEARLLDGFRPLSRVPEFIEYSVQLGLGFGHPSQTRWLPLDAND